MMLYSVGILLCCFLLDAVHGQATETRKVTDRFDGIAVSGPFSVLLTLGTEPSIKLKGNANVIKNIETVVEEGSLHIRFADGSGVFTGILQIEVTAVSIINLIAAGPSQVIVQTPLDGKSIRIVIAGSAGLQGTFSGENLSIVLSESGSFIATVTEKNLNAVISDSGTMTISGSAENANVVISGSGVFHGQNLVVQSVSTTVSGSGRAEVHGVKEVKAMISDLGVVRYVGTPKVTSEKHDLGAIEKMV